MIRVVQEEQQVTQADQGVGAAPGVGQRVGPAVRSPYR
jgi:hypothetical protein